MSLFASLTAAFRQHSTPAGDPGLLLDPALMFDYDFGNDSETPQEAFFFALAALPNDSPASFVPFIPLLVKKCIAQLRLTILRYLVSQHHLLRSYINSTSPHPRFCPPKYLSLNKISPPLY
ncbi:hypothetical protein Zmor_009371 [Zophobas morio]|uniref:Uncharacterized protein n=1 Tax=Zophobas morio TaxID=2755281 RepID=A0AA38IP77_9CUCU|nr:hypothetical protein Zmor_009371 [Zophobas morio]